PGLLVSPIAVDNETAKFDLILSVTDTGEEFIAGFEYNQDIFEPETITRMLGHFGVLLEGIVSQPNSRVSDLPILTESESRKLLVEWNDTRTGYPRSQSVHQLFEEQVAKTPQAPALSFMGATLSYAELNARANQLAHALKKAGVASGSLVRL